MGHLPTFWYERRLWNKGHQVVAGLDEVGRGAWAGPLVVGATAFPSPLSDPSDLSYLMSLGIDDSKRIRPRKREALAKIIKENVLAWAVAEVPVSVINRLGMGKATQMGFRKVVRNLRQKLAGKHIDFVLIDAFYISRMAGLPQGKKSRQLAIINGDQKSISIAAASIIAKVYRDKLMQKLAKRYKLYEWGRNKGYGTAEHQAVLRQHGQTRWHRRRFVETGLSAGQKSSAGQINLV